MATKAEATADDLARVEGKAELVNDEIVHMSPAGGLYNVAAGGIFASLREYARRTKSGRAFTDNAGFVVNLPNRKSFSPEAAFFFGPVTVKFVQGAPAFAVEVRSEDDYGPAAEHALAAKRADYFAAGTFIVWDVDLLHEPAVRVYRADAPDQPAVFQRGEVADAEPAVPGWAFPVGDLWT